MNARMQSDAQIYCTVVVLGLILVASVVVSILLTRMERPLPGLLVALGLVAATGLARLLFPSPSNQTRFE